MARRKKSRPEITLSPRQEAILKCIATRWDQKKGSPSIRELAKIVGIASPSSVKNQVDNLVRMGILCQNPHISRSVTLGEAGIIWARANNVIPSEEENISISKRSTNSIFMVVDNEEFYTSNEDIQTSSTIVPLAGKIAAGAPITAEQNVEEVLTLPASLTGGGKIFALTVSGDSMIDAAICDGDIVVVRVQPTANNGEIVAALIDGEATVKVINRKDHHVWILPRNSSYAPILADDSSIMGKVVTVLRPL